MLEIQNLTKQFENTTALDGVDLAVPPGQTTVLIGPSGCGKSTLLRLIIGLIHPDDGRIHWRNKPISRRNTRQLRLQIGYVIQESGLFPHLTARENVTLMAHQLNWPDAKIQKRLNELLSLTHLPKRTLDQYPGQLSGGQRQRISLMRALMLEPDLLLLDEPLGALDPLIRAELQTDLRDIFEQLDQTVLLVTHDMHEAAFFGHRIAMMREGRIIQTGTLDQLLNEPADPFVRRFIDAQRGSLEART